MKLTKERIVCIQDAALRALGNVGCVTSHTQELLEYLDPDTVLQLADLAIQKLSKITLVEGKGSFVFYCRDCTERVEARGFEPGQLEKYKARLLEHECSK